MICNKCNKKVHEIIIRDNFSQGMIVEGQCHEKKIIIFMTYSDFVDRENMVINFDENIYEDNQLEEYILLVENHNVK